MPFEARWLHAIREMLHRPAVDVVHILMVCTANVCRSPMAHIVVASQAQRRGLARRIHIESAGTQAGRLSSSMDTRAANALRQRGYAVGKTQSRAVEGKDFQRFDHIVAMDIANLEQLRRRCPAGAQHKLSLYLARCTGMEEQDVPDPYYGNCDGFERVLDLCEAGAQGWLQAVETGKPHTL